MTQTPSRSWSQSWPPRGLVVLLTLALLASCDTTTPDEHFQRALGFERNGELNAAVIELKNALQKDAAHAASRFELGKLYYRLGDMPSSLKELERALDLGVDRESVMPELLRTKLALARHEEVLGALESLPENPRYLTLEGRARLLSGEFDLAEARFARALELDAGSAGAKVGAAIVRWRDGDVDSARELLGEAVELEPAEWEHWAVKAQFEIANGDVDTAIRSYLAMLEIPGRALSTRIGLARAYLVNRDLPNALEQSELVLARAPMPAAHYIKGVVQFENGDIDGAEKSVLEVLSVIPNHALSQYMLGVIKYRQGHFGQAIDNLQRFLARNPDNLVVRKMIAAIRTEQKNFAEVIELLEDDEVTLPDVQVLAMLGNAYLAEGRPDDAREALEQASLLAPDNPALLSQLAMVHIASGENAAAEAALGRAAELNEGETARDAFLQALVSLRESRFEEALERGERLVQEAPDNPVAYNVLGAAKIGLGDMEGAMDAFNKALDANPDYTPAAQNLSRLAQFDDPDRAVTHFQRLVDDNPSNVSALIGQARAHYRAGRRDVAREVMRQADEALGEDPPGLQLAQMGGLLHSIGLTELAQKRFDQAISTGERTTVFQVVAVQSRVQDREGAVATLNGWLATNPDDEQAQMALASALISDDRDQALTMYQSLAEEKPDDPVVLNNMAWIYMEQGDERALPTARRAHALMPESPQIADTLGWILLQAGNVDEALPLLESANAGLENADPSVQYHLAEAYRKSGDLASASSAIQRALEKEAFNEREAALELQQALQGP